MIEGLKVTILGSELRQLCSNRSLHHRNRASEYAAQVQNFTGAKIESMGYTNGDPIKAMTDKRDEHLREAEEMEFISAHIDLNQEYLLERSDLYTLGIVSRYH